MDLGGYSLAGPRDANEDSFCVHDFPQNAVFANGVTAFIMVSDGMGGYQGGDVASTLAVHAAECYLDQIIELASSNQVELDVGVALREIAENAHESVLAESSSRGNVNMGATFVGAFISPTHAWIGHIGDSRAYRIRNGEALQLTEDHSQVGRMLSHGIITEEEAQNHPSRNRIERALGFPNAEVELDEVDLQEGDVLLLCSDGVYTVLGKEALAAQVAEAIDAQGAAQQVVESAIKNHTDDNVTATVAFIERPDPFAPSADSTTAALPDRNTALAPVIKHSDTIAMDAEESAQLRARLDEPPVGYDEYAYSPGTRRTHYSRGSSGYSSRRGTRSRNSSAVRRRQPVKQQRTVPIKVIAIIAAIVVLAALAIYFGSQALIPQSGSTAGDSLPSEVVGVENAASEHTEGNMDAGESNDMQKFKVRDDLSGNEAYLKYVCKSQNKAHCFDRNDKDDCSDVFEDCNVNIAVAKDVELKASVEISNYGRNNKEYRRLDDKYLEALEKDAEEYSEGKRSFTSKLSKIVDSKNDYSAFLEQLTQDEYWRDKIECLVLSTDALQEV